MRTPEDIAAHINLLLPDVLSGSLCFFGEWFGGRPDNWHVVMDASAPSDEALLVRFNEGEVLTVVRPDGVNVSPDTFRIEHADRVRWEWFYYGRPKRPENLYAIEYVRGDSGVEVTDTTDWYHPEHSPDSAAPSCCDGLAGKHRSRGPNRLQSPSYLAGIATMPRRTDRKRAGGTTRPRADTRPMPRMTRLDLCSRNRGAQRGR